MDGVWPTPQPKGQSQVVESTRMFGPVREESRVARGSPDSVHLEPHCVASTLVFPGVMIVRSAADLGCRAISDCLERACEAEGTSEGG